LWRLRPDRLRVVLTMSRLYASISSDASKTEGTRRGHRVILSHTRGWNIGVKVRATVRGDEVVLDIYATGGSNGAGREHYLGTVESLEGKRWFNRAISDGVLID